LDWFAKSITEEVLAFLTAPCAKGKARAITTPERIEIVLLVIPLLLVVFLVVDWLSPIRLAWKDEAPCAKASTSDGALFSWASW
jgi:hypothetical protein